MITVEKPEFIDRMNTNQSMKVEIWSDVMCPFCYIGKRKFESAMKEFSDAGNIELEWHSFQLDPEIVADPDKNIYEYLSERKGMSYEQSVQMHDHVVKMAAESGLTYNFDKAVVANSFDAHRLIQLAKTKGLGDEIEEQLFKAYFTEGKDFGNHEVLTQLGKEIGLYENEVSEVLGNREKFAAEVKKDIQEAARIGVRGVPFFVFDRKFAVSGAQPSEVFLNTLQKSFGEWREANPVFKLEVADGPTCTPDGECN